MKGLVIPMKRFPHIEDELNLAEAVRALQEFTCGEYERMRYSEMLVLDADNQLVGRVSLQGILKGLDPNLAQMFEGFQGKAGEFPNLPILWGDSFFSACNSRFGKNIKEFMTPLPTPVKENESALKALSIMLTHNETVLPVLNEAGDEVLGVIRLEEIFNAIVRHCTNIG
ncbi:HPP family protein [Desulfurivibrio sp. D14AmB]|uniref:CBS domain-containing protein n=1 Tax=Desulfurivibrio sp. D14AmB TaxID=3374370 RepID=UPI00376F14E9